MKKNLLLLAIYLLPLIGMAQTTIFTDNFNRGVVVTPISAGGTPSMTYTTRTTSTGTGSGATSTTVQTSGSNYSMQILPSDISTGKNQTNGITTVSGTYPTGTIYNSTLSSNIYQIVWTFNMKINRNTFPLSGFTDGNWAGGVVFAATNEYIANLPASPTPAVGYAVVFEKGTVTTNTTVVGATTSSKSVVVASLTGIQVGQAINGTGAGSNSCVTAIDVATKTLTLSVTSSFTNNASVNFSATTLKLKKTTGGFGTTGGTSLITPTTDFFQGGVASTGSTSGTYSATNPYKTDWISVKVIYTPGTGWELLARGDGKDVPNSDFSSGFTSLGTSSDASYVSDSYPITNFGFLWNHSTTSSALSGQVMSFDNFSLIVNTYPAINNPSVNSLSGFAATKNAASTEQSFSISGQYLANPIVAIAPAGYEVSATSGVSPSTASWGSSVSLTPSSGSVSATVYVRLKNNSSATADADVNGNVLFTSDGVTVPSSYKVALTGTVAVSPKITLTANTLTQFANTAPSSSSTSKSFSITGVNLPGSVVTITAPTNYTVSTDDVSYGSSKTVSVTSGVASGTIYVKFSPTGNGVTSGNINISSQDITDVTVAVSGNLKKFYFTSAGGDISDVNNWSGTPDGTGTTRPSTSTITITGANGMTTGRDTITLAATNSNIKVGLNITGSGIPVNTKVTYYSSSALKMAISNAATLTDANASFTLGSYFTNTLASDSVSYVLLANASTSANAFVMTGLGSKLVIGDPSYAGVTFTIANGYDFATNNVGVVDIPAASTGSGSGYNNFIIQNPGTPPALGALHSTSEVHYQAAISTGTSATFGKVFIESNSAGAASVSFSGTPMITKSLTVDASSSLTINSTSNPYAYIAKDGIVTINGSIKSSKTAGIVSFNKSAGDPSSTIGTAFQFFDADNGSNFILGSASSVELSKATSATTQIIAPRSYYNLTLSGADNNKSLSGAATVSGTFTINMSGSSTITGLSSLTLGNGATIVRTAGTFDGTPTFGSSVNLNYNGTTAITSGFEIPSDATKLSNLTLNNAGGLTLGSATKVNGILTLSAGTLTNGSNLTLGNSASIVRSAGSFDAAPTFGTSLDLTYTGTTAITSGFEIPSSTSVLQNLTLNNAAGLTLASDATLNNTLTLTSGKLSIGAGKTLTLPSSAASISGAGATKYIVTANDGTNIGKVKLTGFATAKTLPVGTTSYYLPVSLTPASSSDFEVSVFQGATTSGALGGTAVSADNKLNIVDAVWTVNRTSGTGNCAMQLTWDAALEGSTFSGNPSDVALGISRYDGNLSLWSTCTKTDGSILGKSVTQTFSSFSPFIIGSASFTLPVTLTNISATVKPVGVELVWETANEDGIRQYVVEKSNNGVDFNAIGFVNASNKGKYIFTDGSASTGVFYYRLKIVSASGEIAYSKVMMVKTTAAVSVSVYPNPVANSITISGLSGKTSLKIINTAGVTLKQINTAANTLSLDVNDLKAGVYILQAVDVSGKVKTVTFIKL